MGSNVLTDINKQLLDSSVGSDSNSFTITFYKQRTYPPLLPLIYSHHRYQIYLITYFRLTIDNV